MGRFGLPGREMALVPQRAGEAKRIEKKSAHRRQYELRYAKGPLSNSRSRALCSRSALRLHALF
jgi:hypothetical protein